MGHKFIPFIPAAFPKFFEPFTHPQNSLASQSPSPSLHCPISIKTLWLGEDPQIRGFAFRHAGCLSVCWKTEGIGLKPAECRFKFTPSLDWIRAGSFNDFSLLLHQLFNHLLEFSNFELKFRLNIFLISRYSAES